VLFKTRVGLCVVDRSFEIVVHQADISEIWTVYAHLRQGGEFEGKSFFKKFNFGGTWVSLIAFNNHAGIEAEVGKAMQFIAEAMTSSLPICDLSQLGSADAWGKKRKQIQWA
jgi:hypothetical protein